MKFFEPATKQQYFDTKDQYALSHFTKELENLITTKNTRRAPVVILCIGTDRATGDCLGPIIGYKLKNLYLEQLIVYGTLENPIHAKNLEDTLSHIRLSHGDSIVIAIDACLGKTSHIGLINMGEGSLKPGSGVNKVLPSVGDIFITGIVNFSGFMDIMVLQNTRLNTVMEMADFISSGLKRVFTKMYLQQSHIS